MFTVQTKNKLSLLQVFILSMLQRDGEGNTSLFFCYGKQLRTHSLSCKIAGFRRYLKNSFLLLTIITGIILLQLAFQIRFFVITIFISAHHRMYMCHRSFSPSSKDREPLHPNGCCSQATNSAGRC